MFLKTRKCLESTGGLRFIERSGDATLDSSVQPQTTRDSLFMAHAVEKRGPIGGRIGDSDKPGGKAAAPVPDARMRPQCFIRRQQCCRFCRPHKSSS